MPSNGGPAFPMPYSTDAHDAPCNVTMANEGMSLRDWFAGQVLVAVAGRADSVRSVEGVARVAYAIADEMLKMRNE